MAVAPEEPLSPASERWHAPCSCGATMISRHVRHALALTSLSSFLAASACGQSICDCTYNFAQLEVAPAVASAVTRSRVSGSSCELRCFDADFRPVEAGAPQACANYTLTKTEPGTCEVTLDFTDGKTFTRNVAFVAKGTKNCCGGIYPENDSRIVVSR